MFTLRTITGTRLLRLFWIYVLVVCAVLALHVRADRSCDMRYHEWCVSTPTNKEG